MGGKFNSIFNRVLNFFSKGRQAGSKATPSASRLNLSKEAAQEPVPEKPKPKKKGKEKKESPKKASATPKKDKQTSELERKVNQRNVSGLGARLQALA